MADVLADDFSSKAVVSVTVVHWVLALISSSRLISNVVELYV